MRRIQISKKLRFEVLSRDGFRCQYCGAAAPRTELQVDHIHPVDAGGSNDPLNLITACVACNVGKGALLLARGSHQLNRAEACIGTVVILQLCGVGVAGVIATPVFEGKWGDPVVGLSNINESAAALAERRRADWFTHAGLSRLRRATTHYIAGRWVIGEGKSSTGYSIEPYQEIWQVSGPDDFADLAPSYELARVRIELHSERESGVLRFLNGSEEALH